MARIASNLSQLTYPSWVLSFSVSHSLRALRSRSIQRAAESDIISLGDRSMNANSATKPRMISIKNLAKNGPVGVLKRCFYNQTRTHLSLNKDSPVTRPIETVGRILPVPILGGLHHQYLRI